MSKLKPINFIQLFLAAGSFCYLSWYMPVAMRDGKVTVVEAAMILVNMFSLLLNLGWVAYRLLTPEESQEQRLP